MLDFKTYKSCFYFVETFITATKRRLSGARTWNTTTANPLIKWNTAWSLLVLMEPLPTVFIQSTWLLCKERFWTLIFFPVYCFFVCLFAGEILRFGVLATFGVLFPGWLFLLRLIYHLNPVHLSPTAKWRRVCMWFCVRGCISYPFTLVVVIIDLPYGSRGSRARCLQHKTDLPHQGRISYWLP